VKKSICFPLDYSEFIDWCRVYIENLSAEMEELNKCWRKCVRLYRKYQNACLSGDSQQARKYEYWLVRSHACRIVFYIMASGADRFDSNFKRKSMLAMKKEAVRVNPRRFSGEKVHVTLLDKPNGGKRPIVSFGQIATANQILVNAILHARHPRSPYEFARKGRGKEAATQLILKNISKGDKSNVAIADIRNSFESMTLTTVLDLKLLPASMILNTIFVPDEAMKTNISKTLASAVRNGIPQGSGCSNFIQEKVIETFLIDLGAKFSCNHGDDILILEKDQATASAILDTLVHRMSVHASGPLTLKPKSVAPVGHHMNYCGYWFRWRKPIYGGGPRVTPSNESLRRLYQRLARRLILTSQNISLKHMETYSHRWARSFGSWTGKTIGIEYAMDAFIIDHYPKICKVRTSLWSDKSTYDDFRQLREKANTLADECIPENVLVDFTK